MPHGNKMTVDLFIVQIIILLLKEIPLAMPIMPLEFYNG
jgi:hypothetical protein